MSSARCTTRAVALALLITACNTSGVYLGNDLHASPPNTPVDRDASGADTGGASGGQAGKSPPQEADSGDGASGKPTGSGGMSSVNAPKDAGTRADAGARIDAGARTDAGTVPAGCATGLGDCDGNPNNGCETKLDTDAIHCGTCDNACPAFGPMSFGSSCMAGHCVLVCEGPFADCDGLPNNGCETLGPGNGACP